MHLQSPPMLHHRHTYHRRSLYATLARHASLLDGRRVLHVGGARDFWVLQSAAAVTSVDLAPHQGTDVLGDACALPFADNSFDGALSVEVLEHVPAPQAMVQELHRVLRPGGVVLLTTPFMWPIHRYPRDYWRLTPDSLQMLFDAFESCDVVPLNGAQETLMHVLWLYSEMGRQRLRLPRHLLYLLKPVEWLVTRLVPKERCVDRTWTTGWLVVAHK